MSTYRAILPNVDVVSARDEEAAIAAGPSNDPMELAHRIAEPDSRQVIIKQGDGGAVALVDRNEFRRKAITVQVVNTDGAVDAFVAGYIAELLAGLVPHHQLETAVSPAPLPAGHYRGLAGPETANNGRSLNSNKLLERVAPAASRGRPPALWTWP